MTSSLILVDPSLILSMACKYQGTAAGRWTSSMSLESDQVKHAHNAHEEGIGSKSEAGSAAVMVS